VGSQKYVKGFISKRLIIMAVENERERMMMRFMETQ